MLLVGYADVFGDFTGADGGEIKARYALGESYIKEIMRDGVQLVSQSAANTYARICFI